MRRLSFEDRYVVVISRVEPIGAVSDTSAVGVFLGVYVTIANAILVDVQEVVEVRTVYLFPFVKRAIAVHVRVQDTFMFQVSPRLTSVNSSALFVEVFQRTTVFGLSIFSR